MIIITEYIKKKKKKKESVFLHQTPTLTLCRESVKQHAICSDCKDFFLSKSFLIV